MISTRYIAMARFLIQEAREVSSKRLSEERVEGSTSGSDASLSEEIPWIIHTRRKKRPESRATFPSKRHASNDDRQDVLKAIQKSNRKLDESSSKSDVFILKYCSIFLCFSPQQSTHCH